MTEEQLETRMSQIVDQMGYLMMDVLLMSLKKINTENQLLQELQEIRLNDRKDEFYNFGETEPGSAGEQLGKG